MKNKMKIKTTKQIIKKAIEVGEIADHDRIYFCDSTPRARKYIDVEDLIKYLKEFPSFHYSSLTVNRQHADKNTEMMRNRLKVLLDRKD